PDGYWLKLESAAMTRALDDLQLSGALDIVGHSFGALVALDFALDHPDRVRTLVLAEPPAFWAVPAEELRANAGMRGMVELGRTLGPADEPTDEQLERFLFLLGRRDVKRSAPGQPGWEEWVSKRSALR